MSGTGLRNPLSARQDWTVTGHLTLCLFSLFFYIFLSYTILPLFEVQQEKQRNTTLPFPVKIIFIKTKSRSAPPPPVGSLSNLHVFRRSPLSLRLLSPRLPPRRQLCKAHTEPLPVVLPLPSCSAIPLYFFHIVFLASIGSESGFLPFCLGASSKSSVIPFIVYIPCGFRIFRSWLLKL